MSIDYRKIKKFWDFQVSKYKQNFFNAITNFENDEELQKDKMKIERTRIFRLLDISKNTTILDMGAGVGVWSFELAPKCKKVTAVEFSKKLIGIAKIEARKRGINNIVFIHKSAQDFKTDEKYDIVFISGLIMYLNDREVKKLLENVDGYTEHGSLILLREPTGVEDRYEIIDQWSEALQTDYSAIYRNRDELVNLFIEAKFCLKFEDNMYENGHALNKWKETRLRLYLFMKNKKNEL